MRNVVLAGVVLAVIGIVLFLVTRDNSVGTPPPVTPGSASSQQSKKPSMGSGFVADPKDPQVQTKFQARKLEAITQFQEQAMLVVRGCKPAAASSARSAPTPRTISVHFEWDASLSTEELQRYVAKGFTVVDSAAPIAPESMSCLDGLTGATLNVLLSRAEIPANARELNEPVSIPLQ